MCAVATGLSLHTIAGACRSFTPRLRRATFHLIIVVSDVSKRIMRMKCDKNYFHVTSEHLTSRAAWLRRLVSQSSQIEKRKENCGERGKKKENQISSIIWRSKQALEINVFFHAKTWNHQWLSNFTWPCWRNRTSPPPVFVARQP